MIKKKPEKPLERRMLKKTKEGYYLLETFNQEEGIIHGFSTRKFGDMSVKKSLEENDNLEKFLRVLRLKKKGLVMMEQVHSNKVKRVGKEEVGSVIKRVDGLVTREKEIILGVKVADCLPVLFYEPQKKVIGVAHAGWKGVLAKIGQVTVKKMKSIGSQPEKILIGIGPHIGSCCYTVDAGRAREFVEEFGNLPEMIVQNDKKIHLNLIIPLIVQLIKVGVLEENIEPPLVCSFCQNDEFFSYRRDSDKTYGEILGVISLVN